MLDYEFHSYFFMAAASKKGGSLALSVNAKMFDTTLYDAVSAFVLNEVQTIEISSTIVAEAYVS